MPGWLYSAGAFTAPAPYQPSADDIRAARLAAYRVESDPLKIEAEYDAQVGGTASNYTSWLAKVAEIKARYPLPE